MMLQQRCRALTARSETKRGGAFPIVSIVPQHLASVHIVLSRRRIDCRHQVIAGGAHNLGVDPVCDVAWMRMLSANRRGRLPGLILLLRRLGHCTAGCVRSKAPKASNRCCGNAGHDGTVARQTAKQRERHCGTSEALCRVELRCCDYENPTFFPSARGTELAARAACGVRPCFDTRPAFALCACIHASIAHHTHQQHPTITLQGPQQRHGKTHHQQHQQTVLQQQQATSVCAFDWGSSCQQQAQSTRVGRFFTQFLTQFFQASDFRTAALLCRTKYIRQTSLRGSARTPAVEISE